MPHAATIDSFLFSDDPNLLNVDTIHAFLSTSYWSPGIARSLVERAIANSIPFGVYEQSPTPTHKPNQVGFARIISDKATYAYLADVFILEPFRGRNLSKRLVEHILAHPDLQGLRRIALMTRDAQGLYAQFGFKHLEVPQRYMERTRPGIYGQSPPPPS